MYQTIVVYQADGIQRDFAVPYPYIKKEYVKAYKTPINPFGWTVGGSMTAIGLTWLNTGYIRLDEVVPAGHQIIIQRETFNAAPLVDFQDAAIITEQDLDLAVLQMLHVAQEARDRNSYEILEAATALLLAAQQYEATAERAEEAAEQAQKVLEECQATLEDIKDVLNSMNDLSQGGLGGPVGTMYFTSDGLATSYTVPKPSVGRNILLMAFEVKSRRKVYFAEKTPLDGSIVLELAEPLPLGTRFGVVFLRAVNTGEASREPITYVHTEDPASDTWVINHEIVKGYPRVFRMDNAGQVMVSGEDWSQAPAGTLTLRFSEPVAGVAVLTGYLPETEDGEAGRVTYSPPVPATMWVIEHELVKKYPGVFVMDTAGNRVFGREDWTQAAAGKLTLRFSEPLLGTAMLTL